MVPYSQVSMEEHVEIISCYESRERWDTLMDHNLYIDENNCRYIVRSFLKHWKQRLLSEKFQIKDEYDEWRYHYPKLETERFRREVLALREAKAAKENK